MYEFTSVVIGEFKTFHEKIIKNDNQQDLYKSLHYVHYS